MNQSKPSKTYFSKVLPVFGGYMAQFSLPGLSPNYVRENGKPKVFKDEDEAETAALWALTAVLQNRIYDERKAGPYHLLTGAQLANEIDAIGITVTEFGVLGGWPQSRVMKWLEGEADIPHYVRVFAKLLASPLNLAEARKATNDAMKGA